MHIRSHTFDTNNICWKKRDSKLVVGILFQIFDGSSKSYIMFSDLRDWTCFPSRHHQYMLLDNSHYSNNKFVGHTWTFSLSLLCALLLKIYVFIIPGFKETLDINYYFIFLYVNNKLSPARKVQFLIKAKLLFT